MEILKKLREAYEQIAKVFQESRVEAWIEELSLIPEEKYNIVIDLGCGCGANVRYLARKLRYRLYLGCDFSINILSKVKDLNIDLICCCITHLPFKSRCADLALIIATLHHVPEKSLRLNVLKQVAELLRDKGLMLVTVWGVESKIRRGLWLSTQDVIIPWSWGLEREVHRYYHLYTLNELIDEILSAGFKIIQAKTVFRGGNANHVVLALND
ncbi:MAG: hypothetical protein B6V02_01245 [Thermoprotei archaeon ex4572_64]|nr:MAG: hypothetical protein B6V02_01245 [Thermoprotei archaeon ex4572_64]